jgi:hypothetical protein
MPKTESLDELIAQKAAEFADQIKAAAAMADKEEEIRIAAERQLAFIEKATGIKLEGKHEFTVASGRVDSVYDRVIIEYKNPKSPGARIGPKADSPGSKKVVEQIKKRFYDMRAEHRYELNTMFGVGLDGNYFIFIRFRDDKWHVQEPVEVNRYSAERFLWALYNLGQKGKPFSSEYLAGDFGSESKLAQDGVRALYNAIIATDNPKAQIFFSQWKILFGEVCGYDVDNPSDKIKKLAEFYGVEHRKKFKAAELLFAVHSYYAIFMKLLASEIAAYFHKLPTPLQKMLQASSSNALKREMEDLEAGSIFRYLNITNFLEGDLFAWYVPVWSEPIEQLVRGMVARLDDYNPGTLSEDPAGSRDLLKKLYQQLFPKSVRHDLGEYYTPDWLAEHVLNELKYIGDPDKRLLDPACGSGTFLVMAINRIRKWYDENRESCRFDEGDLCRKILSNVIGFELNPLAVMAARTNYLIAIRDLVGHVDKIEIPIYLCDSIMTPSEYGGLFGSGLGKAKELKTAAAKFIIPTEIAMDRDSVAKYAEQLEFGVRNGYSREEFFQRCREEGLAITEDRLHSELYDELVKLDKANKNGVWARIIKNAFAPLFTEPVDFVVGNPPWVFWNNLPSEYRDQARHLMADTYGIIAKGASTMRRLGQAGKDLSMLFFYVSLDIYMKRKDGKLGFVITQTLCQTTAATEFRQFRLPNGSPICLSLVDDWVSVDPFTSAANKTAVFYAHTGEPTAYPLPYRKWEALRPFDRDTAQVEEVYECCVYDEFQAVPSSSDRRSFWVLTKGETHEPTSDATSSLNFKVRRGVETTLESAFRLRILQRTRTPGILLAENNRDRAKKELQHLVGRVEQSLIYPFVTGASIDRWRIESSGYYLVPHLPTTGMEPISEVQMRQEYKNAYEFLSNFRDELLQRSLYKRWGKSKPFYSMFDIGTYTFNPYRVAWKRTTRKFAAAVMGYVNDEWLGKVLLIPNGKIMFIPCDSREAAHFVCALLNSSPARLRINRSISSEVHAEMINLVQLPRYDVRDERHKRLSDLAIQAHKQAASDEIEELELTENAIDLEVALLWKITETELTSIQNAVERMEASRSRKAKPGKL